MLFEIALMSRLLYSTHTPRVPCQLCIWIFIVRVHVKYIHVLDAFTQRILDGALVNAKESSPFKARQAFFSATTCIAP